MKTTQFKYLVHSNDFLNAGNVSQQMMYNTYNMGLGMIVAVDPKDVDKAMEAMKSAGDVPYVVGKIVDGEKGVDLV